MWMELFDLCALFVLCIKHSPLVIVGEVALVSVIAENQCEAVLCEEEVYGKRNSEFISPPGTIFH